MRRNEDPAPGRVRPRPGAWAEIRLLLAEWLLGLALRIAPPDHPQSELMARLAWLYVTRMRKDIERLEREWLD